MVAVLHVGLVQLVRRQQPLVVEVDVVRPEVGAAAVVVEERAALARRLVVGVEQVANREVLVRVQLLVDPGRHLVDVHEFRAHEPLPAAGAEARNVDAVAGQKGPRRRACCIDLCSRRVHAGRRRERIAIFALVGCEEVRAVLLNRSADCRAVLDALEWIGRQGAIRIGTPRPQAVILKQEQAAAAQIVGPGARDHVDDAAGGLAVFGLEAVDEHLDLLDRIERRALVREPGDLVGVVDAVDVPGVRPSAGSAKSIRIVVRGRARHEAQKSRVVAA